MCEQEKKKKKREVIVFDDKNVVFNEKNTLPVNSLKTVRRAKSDSYNMCFPNFLSKSLRTKEKVRVFDKMDIKIDVTPSALGSPTIYDKKIFNVICTVTDILKQNNRLQCFENVDICLPYDAFFYFLDLKKDTDSIYFLEKAIFRMANTGIFVQSSDKVFDTQKNGVGCMTSFFTHGICYRNRQMACVRLSPWLYGFFENNKILSFDRKIMLSKSEVVLKLYELVRKFAGTSGKTFPISIEKLQGYFYNNQNKKHFKEGIKIRISDSEFPEYELKIEGNNLLAKYIGRKRIPNAKTPVLSQLKPQDYKHCIRKAQEVYGLDDDRLIQEFELHVKSEDIKFKNDKMRKIYFEKFYINRRRGR